MREKQGKPSLGASTCKKNDAPFSIIKFAGATIDVIKVTAF